MGEVSQQRCAVRRVHHLGMELHAVIVPRIVGDRRERRALRHANHAEPWRQRRHPVPVAHPHLLARTFLPDVAEQRAIAGDIDEGAAEFAMVGRLHLAAELLTQQLLAVADAQDRHAEFEHRRGGKRRGRLMRRSRARRTG